VLDPVRSRFVSSHGGAVTRGFRLTPTTSRISRWGWPAGGVSLDDAISVLTHSRGPAYVFGVDQAQLSGVAVTNPLSGTVLTSGVARGTPELVAALERLRNLPAFDWQNVLVVFEDHAFNTAPDRQRWSRERGAPDRSSSNREAVALGDARGRWQALLDLRNHPKSQRLLVLPHQWRRAYKGARLPGETENDACCRWASAQAKERIEQPDQAAAIGIAVWGSVEGLCTFAADRLRARAAAAATRARPSNDNGSTS
jgi:hypothetical protein